MKGKNLQPRITGKVLIQIWWRDQNINRQAEATRVHHHKARFTRNVKGTPQNEKEKGTIGNMKIMKEKSSSVKANI